MRTESSSSLQNALNLPQAAASLPWASLLTWTTLCFLTGRAVLFDQLFAFAVALYAALLFTDTGHELAVALPILLGIYTRGGAGAALSYLPLFILLAAAFHMRGEYLRERMKQYQLAAALITLVVRGGYQLGGAFNPYLLLLALLEAAVVGLLAGLFPAGLKRFKESYNPRPLSDEQRLSLLLLLGALGAGLTGVMAGPLHLAQIYIYLVVMLVAFWTGAERGAAIGAFLGFVLMVTGRAVPTQIMQYTLGGLIAGLLKEYGRLGVGTGFFISAAFAAMYVNSELALASFLEVGVAIIPFLVITGRTPSGIFVRTLSEDRTAVRSSEDGPEKQAVSYLERTAENLYEVSRGLTADLNTARQKTAPDLASVVNIIADRICSECQRRERCWDDNFYCTFRNFMRFIARLEKNGGTQVRGTALDEFCLYPQKIGRSASSLLRRLAREKNYKRRVEESAVLVSDQIQGIGEFVEDLAQEIARDLEAHTQIAEILKRGLNRSGFIVYRIDVRAHDEDRIAVEIERPPCSPGSDCQKVMGECISGLLRRPITVRKMCCCHERETERCALLFRSPHRYSVRYATASIARSGEDISGDSTAIRQADDGRFFALVSDGMGFGRSAAFESGTVIRIFLRLVEVGFRPELALRTVNTILILGSGGRESFATLDLITIDLYNGEGRLIKVGAPPTYIRRDGEIKSISTSCLPVGILNELEVETVDYTFEPDDQVVLATDGVIQSLWEKRGEVGFTRYLRCLPVDDPEQIAESLVREAEASSEKQEEVGDDMTALVLSIEKNPGGDNGWA